jgi:hypothetical protein
LLENDLAEQQFESALALKLSNITDLSAAFQLFRLNEQNKKSEKYKSYILDKYPNSDAAKYFLDPDFYLKQKKNAEESQKDYLKLLGVDESQLENSNFKNIFKLLAASGQRHSDGFNFIDKQAWFWTTESSKDNEYQNVVDFYNDGEVRFSSIKCKECFFSIRLVKEK